MDFSLWEIVAIAIGAIAVIFFLKWQQAKNLLKQVAEALTITSSALEDDKLSDVERKLIVKEWLDVILSARELLGR